MKKIEIEGKVYEYTITENGNLSFNGIITYPELQRIKEKLEKERKKIK